MTRPSVRLILLIILYVIFSAAAIWRAVQSQSLDLFTLGVIPVLVGILVRAPWASVVLKIYVALETLGLCALAITAIIAYQLTPEDVKVIVNGHNIPILPLVSSIILLLAFQYWVAFSHSTAQYLNRSVQRVSS